MSKPGSYDPLADKHLAESVAKALLERPCEPLLPPEDFEGAGIYAIYYAGDFPPYNLIAEQNRKDRCRVPIYVGKAIPPGGRKGGFGLGREPGNVLKRRLQEHADSINQVTNLDLAHFACRYLVTKEIWIPLGENLLIEWFSPIWNTVIPGFGIHDPGKGRRRQRRSDWDTLHPGRKFTQKLKPSSKKSKQILEELDAFLRNYFKK